MKKWGVALIASLTILVAIAPFSIPGSNASSDNCARGKPWAFGVIGVKNTEQGEWTKLRGAFHCNGKPVLVRRADESGTLYHIWLVGQSGYKHGFNPSAYHHPEWIAVASPDVGLATDLESLPGESSPTSVILRISNPSSALVRFTIWGKQYVERGLLPTPG